MSINPEELLAGIYNAFNPKPLNPDDSAYVDCQDVRGDVNIIRDLGKTIRISEELTYQLYSGYRGAGKTTELLRLKKDLEDRGFFVVYFAADEEDLSIQDAQYADILLACTRNLLKQLNIADPTPISDWVNSRLVDLQDFVQGIKFDKLSIESQLSLFAKLTASIRSEPSQRHKIREKVDPHTETLIESINKFLADARRKLPEGKRQIVILADNLDRIVPIFRANERSNHEEIFLDRHEQLQAIDCHIVYTVPISMIYSKWATDLKDNYGIPLVLPSVMVQDREGNRYEPGLNKLKEAIKRRIDRLDPNIDLSTQINEVTFMANTNFTFDRGTPFLPSKTTDRLPMLVDDLYRWPNDTNDWLSLSPEGRETYKDLLRSLKRKTGFGLFFAVQPIPAKVDRIIKSLEKDLPLKKIAILELDRDTKTIFDLVDRLYAENHFDILCIKGIENALYDYEDTQRLSGWTTEEVYSYSWKGVPPILNHLNQQRDRFSTEFPSSSFVFFVPSFAVDYFVQRAPDFFDWRSGLFEFPTNKQEFADKFDEVIHGGFEYYLELTKEERIKKSLELKELLQPSIDLETSAKLYSEMALLFVSGGQYIKALASLDRCIDLNPNQYRQLIRRGSILRLLERYKEAFASYERAIEIDPDRYEAWFYRGFTLAKLERHEEALASLDKVVVLNSGDYNVWLLRGNILNDLERYKESLANLDRAIEIEPNKYAAWFNRGNTLIKLERYEEALTSFDRAMINPDDYGIWANRGIALHNLKRYEEALTSFDRAIEISPDDYGIWSLRGNVLGKLERYQEELASFDRAIEINPDDYGIWANRGIALHDLKRYEEALASFDRTVEINPEKDIAWVNRGNTLIELERYKEALDSLNKAIAIDSRCAPAYILISRIHCIQGDTDLAIESLTEVIKCKLINAWNNSGFINLVKNKLDKAIEYFSQSL